eukprot:15231686-Alexandrium_andersonii.AAC.1
MAPTEAAGVCARHAATHADRKWRPYYKAFIACEHTAPHHDYHEPICATTRGGGPDTCCPGRHR